MEDLLESLPDLKELCLIYILTKSTKFLRGTTIDVSKIPPGFMPQIAFYFFNVESIRGLTSTFVGICSATS